jgi:hypothetical protein
MKVSKNWNHIKSFDEVCKETKFSYFYKLGENLAPGDYQYPHLVSSQNEIGLIFTSIEWLDGLSYRGDGISGHGFVNEANKDFEIQIYLDAKECIREYLNLLNAT